MARMSYAYRSDNSCRAVLDSSTPCSASCSIPISTGFALAAEGVGITRTAALSTWNVVTGRAQWYATGVLPASGGSVRRTLVISRPSSNTVQGFLLKEQLLDPQVVADRREPCLTHEDMGEYRV